MYQVYKILPGETLEEIARKMDTTVEKLQDLNVGVRNENISNGYIIIPASNSHLYDHYKIKKGDTIYSISEAYGVDPNILIKINGLDMDDYIYPGETLLIPKENIYITKEETLDDISKNTGLSMKEIAANNPDLIVVSNQVIRY